MAKSTWILAKQAHRQFTLDTGYFLSYSETCLTKFSTLGTLFKVRFTQNSVLLRNRFRQISVYYPNISTWTIIPSPNLLVFSISSDVWILRSLSIVLLNSSIHNNISLMSLHEGLPWNYKSINYYRNLLTLKNI